MSASSLRQFFEIEPPRNARQAADRKTRGRVRRLANEGRKAEAFVIALVITVFVVALVRGASVWVIAGMTAVSALVAGPFLFFFELARRRNRRLVYDGVLVRGEVKSVQECMVPGIHGRGVRGQDIEIAFTIAEQPATCHAVIPEGYAGAELAEPGRRVDLVAHANGEDVLVLGDDWQLIAARGDT